MEKSIYEKYADYFLDKFKDNKKLKFDNVINNENMFAVYIYSESDFSQYFLRVDSQMIYIDGIVVQDEAIEYENINSANPNDIYNFLDEQAKIFQLFLDEGINFYAYKNNNTVVTMSTNVIDRKKLLKEIDIEKFYNQQVFKNHPSFSEIDKIELQDFYGNIIYEYNAKNLNK